MSTAYLDDLAASLEARGVFLATPSQAEPYNATAIAEAANCFIVANALRARSLVLGRRHEMEEMQR